MSTQQYPTDHWPTSYPQLNAVSERYDRTLLGQLKLSLKPFTLITKYWSNSLDYALWTTKCSPIRTNTSFSTPYEFYHSHLPSMRHAHIFGLTGHYLFPLATRNKFDNNSHQCFFLDVLPSGDFVKVLDKLT